MTIDIIFLAQNRLAFTEFSFRMLVENTHWAMVDHLVVYDDGSRDGTDIWLRKQVIAFDETKAVIHQTQLDSPVAIMNHYLDHYSSDSFAKIDNDVVVPPFWLEEMNKQMYLRPDLDILGMQADSGPPEYGKSTRRTIEEARWIGGVGLMRRRAFKHCRPSPHGRFGFTEFQQRHADLTKAWIKPDLATFELDRVPLEPWESLAKEYVALGWSRAWGPYAKDANEYWDWALVEPTE